jgi:hypothetical protein
MEWFVYNRTPAYDNLETQIKQMAEKSPRSERKIQVDDYPQTSTKSERKPTLWERFLPIELQIGKGAITVGNRELPSLLVLDFKSAKGVYKTSPSRSQYDLYKTILQLVFDRTRFQLRDNPDFETTGNGASFARPKYVLKIHDVCNVRISYQPGLLHRIWHRIAGCCFKRAKRRSSQESENASDQEWRGLNRYRLSVMKDRFGDAEYAKVTTILESKQLELTYYTDDPGVLAVIYALNNHSSLCLL